MSIPEAWAFESSDRLHGRSGARPSISLIPQKRRNFFVVSNRRRGNTYDVFQIIFNELSAAEISQLSTLEQLSVLNEFKVSPDDLDGIEDNDADAPFGQIDRDGKTLYRYRAGEVRIYFEVTDDHPSIVVHRVLSANTFQDFLFRAKLPVGDDDTLAQSKQFWELIEEGERARHV